jgi:hypothetical protein
MIRCTYDERCNNTTIDHTATTTYKAKAAITANEIPPSLSEFTARTLPGRQTLSTKPPRNVRRTPGGSNCPRGAEFMGFDSPPAAVPSGVVN